MARYGSLPFAEQIEFFESKIPVPTNGWADVYGAEHDRAWMVAGISRMDVLADLKAAQLRAITDGTGLRAFRQALRDSQAKKGWAFPGDFHRRSRLIYQTNMRSSYAAGREAQMADPALRKALPYKLYRHGGSRDPRPDHLAWDGLVLEADDAWWDTHSPPNGWGCRCKSFLLDKRAMDRMGLKLGHPPPLKETTVTVGQRSGNPRTVTVPEGIDPSFEHRPGATVLGKLAQLYLDRATGLPAAQAAVAVLGAVSRERVLSALETDYERWLEGVDRGKTRGELFTVGALSPRVVEQLSGSGIALQTASITLRDVEAAHLLRDTKTSTGKAIGRADLLRFVRLVARPDAVLKERGGDTLLLVFEPRDADRKAKIVVRLNYVLKTSGPEGRGRLVTNSIRTAGRVPVITLRDAAQYEVLDGAL